MSAPCHPDATASQAQSNARRRIRRKKVAPVECVQEESRISSRIDFQKSRTVSVERRVEVRTAERRPLTAQNKTRKPKPSGQIRPRQPTPASDIVTLVSLLSPGSSDSEKDESFTAKAELAATGRAPSLRKTGKSVSFQDDSDCQPDETEPSAFGLSPMGRRASLVPLASSIRFNRPPTAPPGSIFSRTIW